MNFRLEIILLLAVAWQAVASEKLRVLTAGEIYRMALAQKLRAGTGGIALEKWILIEDDGPAVGLSKNPDAFDKAGGAAVVKKELILPAAPSSPATLLFWAEPLAENATVPLEAEVNGHSVPYTGGPKYEEYRFLPVPAAFLQAGKNTIVFRAPADSAGWGFFVALDRDYARGSRTRTSAPGRSVKSLDGGRSWSTRLGQKNDQAGEYGVRLFLNEHAAEGVALLPVMNARSLEEPGTLTPGLAAEKVTLTAEGEAPPGTELKLMLRTGSTPFYDAASWSGWKAFDGLVADVSNAAFFQVRAEFRTSDCRVSPVLRRLTMKSSLPEGAPPPAVSLMEDRNQRIILSPVSFEYEPADFPALQKFRKDHDLDRVVAGAGTEFETIIKLRHWVAAMRNIQEDFPKNYPDWNAESIVSRDAKGLRIQGMCIQYNLVLLQACRAFGIQGRHYCIDGFAEMGHEIAEVWSNDFQKWVYLDASLDAHYLDPKTKIPRSLMELHRIFMGTFYRPGETFFSVLQPEMWKRVGAVQKRVPLEYAEGGYQYGEARMGYEWWKEHGYLAAGRMRMTPRDNFLAEAAPVPLRQGTMWPGWDGFIHWEDEQTPRMPVHANYTDKETDLYWTLNQARMVLVSGGNEGELRVHLAHSMPFFDHYEARENGGEWQTRQAPFLWKLTAGGGNRLEVRPVDRMGKTGIISSAAVGWPPR